ncbi:hypothetical protein F7P85_03000 [Kerstersia gyiorum]|nr:hypothetical protein F7P85_03000 [Kerstersia gyiorum]
MNSSHHGLIASALQKLDTSTVAEPTATRGESRELQAGRDRRLCWRLFIVPRHCTPVYGRALAGVRLRTPGTCSRSLNPVLCPPTPFESGVAG